MFKSVLSLLFIASLSTAASALTCSAPRLVEQLPNTMFSSFDLSYDGSKATVSKIQSGQESLNIGISQDQWPESATGDETAEGFFEKFDEISTVTNWDLTVTQQTATTVQLHWSQTGRTFSEVYDCFPN